MTLRTTARPIFFAVCWLLMLTVGTVSAQTPTESLPSSASDEATQVEEIVFDKPTLAAEINTAKELYRGEFEAYRTAEKNYTVAKQQYVQIGTLASLEEAVQATKEVLISRDQVLLSYLEIIRLELLDAGGIEIQQKDAALKGVESTIVSLREQKSKAETIQDRFDVAEAVSSFVVIGAQAEEVSYQAMGLLSIGKLRIVYDASLNLAEELQDSSPESINPLQQGERDRAFAETFRALEQAQQQFVKVETNFNKTTGKQSDSSYSQTNKDLGTVYSHLAKVLSYLQELSQSTL